MSSDFLWLKNDKPYVSGSCRREDKTSTYKCKQKGILHWRNIIGNIKELTIIAKKKGHTEQSDIIIADGHKSRFDGKVMDHCESNFLEQFILPPDTPRVTQKHDHI